MASSLSPTERKGSALKKPSRRAQVSTIDFIVGLIVMSTAVIVAVVMLSSARSGGHFEDIRRTALAASEDLMSEGYPLAWNSSDVITLGLLTDGKLNLTKLEEAKAIPPPDLRTLLSNPYEIAWYFTNRTANLNMSGCVTTSDSALLVGPGCEPSFDPEGSLVRVDRFVAYNDTIIRLVVVVWE